MAQWARKMDGSAYRGLTALTEDLGSVPSPPPCNSGSSEADTLLPPWAPAHMWYN